VAFRGGVSLIRASRSGHGARSVVLHGVPPHLKALRRIVGWDCTPGLVLHERARSTLPRSGGVSGGGCMPARRVVPGALVRTIMVPSAAPGMLERRC
jgi:hypothetical protein